jgi:hypothetical protein
MTIKISNAQMAEVFTDAATALREQAAHITDLETKLASRDQRDRVTKLASEMHRKGLELDIDASALADRLEKAADAGKLEAIEIGVDLVGPDMGSKLASLTNDDGLGVSPGASDFERYIVGTAG